MTSIRSTALPWAFAFLACLLVLSFACAGSGTHRVKKHEEGIVSWYGEPQLTATGARFNPEAMTAAHKTLPFGTVVRVTRLDNRKSVVVTINDRGPYIRGRIIDVARRPARKLDLIYKGIAPCRVEVIRLPGG